jgi:hypothetical protein
MHRDLRGRRQRASTGPTARRSRPPRVLVAACIGNAVEWYDFALYGAFATIMAATYFPIGDPATSLLAAFAAFSTAFIFRPLGALLFGRRGDRRGRRQVLALMIIVMSLATAGVGVLPGYAAIGLLAPVLLILLRLAQGLSAGGEAGAASAFVVEYAPRTGVDGTAGGSGRPWRWDWPRRSARRRCSPGGRRGACRRHGRGAWRSWRRCLSGWSGCTYGYGWTRRPVSAPSSVPTPSPSGPSGKPSGPIPGGCWSAWHWWPRPH